MIEKIGNKVTYYNFIRTMGKKYELDQRTCREIVSMVFESIKDTLLQGNSIDIPEFGHFCLIKTKSRNGTDPNTLRHVTWESRYIPKMYASRFFKKKINDTLQNIDGN